LTLDDHRLDIPLPRWWQWIVIACALSLMCVGQAYGQWPEQCNAPPDVSTPYITVTPMEDVHLASATDFKVVTITNVSTFLVTWYARCSKTYVAIEPVMGVLTPGESCAVAIQGMGIGLGE